MISARIFARALTLLIALLAQSHFAAAQEAEPSTPPVCGDREITIARMGWPSAEILSHIHEVILRGAFDCETRLVAGDTSATGSAMATAQLPAIAPELWVSRIPEIWNAASTASSVLKAGNTFGSGDMQGWFIPKYLAEEFPDLVKLSDLQTHWQIFRPRRQSPEPVNPSAVQDPLGPAPEIPQESLFAASTGPGTFVSCPEAWACAIINRNMLRGLGLQNRLKIFSPTDGVAFDREITKALSRKAPVLFYYWQPTATLAQFEFQMLKSGTFNAEGYLCNATPDCPNPSPTGYGREAVIIAVAAWVQRTAPSIAEYLNLASMPLATMNSLLAWQTELGTTATDVANYFIEVNKPVWSQWLSESQLEKMDKAISNGLLDAAPSN